MALIDISKPRWDQNSYVGRFKHFWHVCNPLNLLYSGEELQKAKDIVTRYGKGENIPNLTEEELWRQKYIYDSSFHPESGEKLLPCARMCAQVPVNMMVTGFMLTFYKTLGSIIFWQWFNQSFNATVNLSNRSSEKKMGLDGDVLKSYLTATSSALVTSVGLNQIAHKFPPIVGRLIPFTAIAAANAINLPLSRQSEIINGMRLIDADGHTVGYSSKVAKLGIAQVVMSRIGMAIPTMVGIPIFMNRLEKSGFLTKYPRFSLPFQVVMCGSILTFSTPGGCALFPQKGRISVDKLEPEVQAKIKAMNNPPNVVYFNKGL